MGCIVKIITDVSNSSGLVPEELMSDGDNTVVNYEVYELDSSVKPGDVTYDDIVSAIMRMPKENREKLSEYYVNAKNFTLDAKAIENLNLVSNTTIDDIFSRLHINRSYYDGIVPSMAENYVLLNCSSMKIGMDEYSGMCVMPDGRKIVVIKSKEDARKFFGYLLAKDAVRNAAEKDLLKYDKKTVDSLAGEDADDYARFMAIAAKFYKKGSPDVVTMMNDFLDSSKKFEGSVDYPGKEAKSFSAVKFINSFMRKVTGKYFINSIANLNNFETEVYNLCTDGSDPFRWTVRKSKLYDVIVKYYPERLERLWGELFPDKELPKNGREFGKINKNEIDMLLIGTDKTPGLFDGCETLGNLITYEYENSNATEDRIESAYEETVMTEYVEKHWNDIMSTLPENNKTRKEYGKYSKFKELPAEERINKFNKIKFKFDENGKTHKVLARKYGSNGVRYYYQEKVDKLVEGTSDSSTVTFRITDMSLGKMFNFGYTDSYPLKPVDNEVATNGVKVENGMYHGMYVYKTKDEDSNNVKYVVTRHILSPKTGGARLDSLDNALERIDSMNKYETMSANAFVSIKSGAKNMFRVNLEAEGLRNNQIISVLDYNLGNIKYDKIFPAFKMLMNKHAGFFHETFDSELGTEALITPEMCATYLMQQYHELFETKKRAPLSSMEDVIDIVKRNHKRNKDKWDKVVDDIANANIANYYLKYKYAPKYRKDVSDARVIRLDGGNVRIGLTGEFVGGKKISEVIYDTMDSLQEYFKYNYADNIVFMTSKEMLTSPELKGLGIEKQINSIRGLIHNGKIYINKSNGDEEDLFHEIAHMFLGVVKKNNFQEYKRLLNHFIDNKDSKPELYKSFNQFLNQVSKKTETNIYSNMALEDRMEEALARTIARQLYDISGLRKPLDPKYGKNNLKVISDITSYPGFNQGVFEGAMKFVTDTLVKMYKKASEENDNGLGFMGWLKGEAGSEEVVNMRAMTNIVRDLIKKGEIETGENC